MILKLIFFMITISLSAYSQVPEYNIGVTVLPKSLDTTTFWNRQEFLIAQVAFRTLTKINSEGRISADIAKSWVAKNGTYSIKLIDNSFFQDGTKVTAKDIVFSLLRHIQPESKSIMKNILLNIFKYEKNEDQLKNFKIINDLELEIYLKDIYPPFLKLLAVPAFSIISHKSTPENIVGHYKYSLHNNEIHISHNNGKYIFRKYSNLSHELAQNKIDIFLGLFPKDLFEIKKLPTFSYKKIKSLVFIHIFLNEKRHPLLKDKIFRVDLKNLISTQIDKYSYLLPNNYSRLYNFMPKGILPINYYKTNHNIITLKDFEKKWSKKTKKPIDLYIRDDFFPKKYNEQLKSSMRSDLFKIHFIKINNFLTRLKQKEYDLISAGYMASFPDPDAFIELLDENSNLQYGNYDSREFINKITQNKFTKGQDTRLVNYAKSINEFEDNGHVIPLFQIDLPLVTKNNIIFPNTNFRFEGDLREIKINK